MASFGRKKLRNSDSITSISFTQDVKNDFIDRPTVVYSHGYSTQTNVKPLLHTNFQTKWFEIAENRSDLELIFDTDIMLQNRLPMVCKRQEKLGQDGFLEGCHFAFTSWACLQLYYTKRK